MAEQTYENAPVSVSAMKVLKMVGPWVVLAVVLFRVWALYGDWQTASASYSGDALRAKNSLIATPTASAKSNSSTAKTTTSKPSDQVEALTDVNVHSEASASADTLWVLAKGDRVTLIQKVGSWLKIKNSKGTVGWVTSGAKYTKVIKAK